MPGNNCVSTRSFTMKTIFAFAISSFGLFSHFRPFWIPISSKQLLALCPFFLQWIQDICDLSSRTEKPSTLICFSLITPLAIRTRSSWTTNWKCLSSEGKGSWDKILVRSVPKKSECRHVRNLCNMSLFLLISCLFPAVQYNSSRTWHYLFVIVQLLQKIREFTKVFCNNHVLALFTFSNWRLQMLYSWPVYHYITRL